MTIIEFFPTNNRFFFDKNRVFLTKFGIVSMKTGFFLFFRFYLIFGAKIQVIRVIFALKISPKINFM